MKIRTVAASMISFVILLLMLSFAANRGDVKIRPKLEATQNRISEQSDFLKNLIARDMAKLGVSSGQNGGSINEMLKTVLGGSSMQSIIRRPVGTWMGLRKSGSSKIAFIKFDKDEYWIKTKDDNNRAVLEHGSYQYGVVELYFQPDDAKPYGMQYEMISPDYIQLFGGEISYHMEKTEDIRFNF